MGLTALGVSAIHAFLGDGGWRDLVAYLAYPLGFIAVIIGRAQLFTENTLTVILPLLNRKDSKTFWNVARLWTVVLVANAVGALVVAAVTGPFPSSRWARTSAPARGLPSVPRTVPRMANASACALTMKTRPRNEAMIVERININWRSVPFLRELRKQHERTFVR